MRAFSMGSSSSINKRKMQKAFNSERDSLVEITRRLLDLKASGSTDSIDEPVRMATSIYCDSDLFEREKKEI